MKQMAPSGKKKSGGGRTVSGFFRISAVSMLLLTAAAVILASLLFSPPGSDGPQAVTADDMILQSRLYKKIRKEVFSKTAKDEAVIAFSRPEADSLIRMADIYVSTLAVCGIYDGMPLSSCRPQIDTVNGKISCTVPIDTGWRWLFGGVIELKISGTAAKNGKNISIRVDELTAGALPLPPSLGEKIAAKSLERAKNSRGYTAFDRLIKDIYFDSGKLYIVYSPRHAAELLKSSGFPRF